MPDPANPYSRLNYRRLIAWPARIEREWPFLEETLTQAPSESVLDLGCGTGEHARHLASNGFRSVGLDRAEDQIAAAREYEGDFGELGPEFLLGEMSDLERLTEERFGAALCLGNVLPHIEESELERSLAALAARLVEGGRLIMQLLNYERILSQNVRAMPINLRDDPDRTGGEMAFVRLMTPDGDHHVRFYPLTLEIRPDEDPPVAIKSAREVRLRAWTRADLQPLLEKRGLRVDSVHGDMTGGSFSVNESNDLVIVAHRQ